MYSKENIELYLSFIDFSNAIFLKTNSILLGVFNIYLKKSLMLYYTNHYISFSNYEFVWPRGERQSGGNNTYLIN